MATRGIVIHWDNADEYLQLDDATLLAGAQITATSEWRPNERRIVAYNTKSVVRKVNSSEFEITLSYVHSSNTHIKFNDSLWGKSVIHFRESASDGIATWYDNNDKNQDGDVTWKRLESGLFKQPTREYYSRIQREKDIFRTALLAFDRCCVISREPMIEALEAAHIIPSKIGGAEVVGNGIILRSDIHRLYDSGYFAIKPSGRVVVVREVSQYYRSILTGLFLPENTVQRVRAALEHQWEAANKKLSAAYSNSTRGLSADDISH